MSRHAAESLPHHTDTEAMVERLAGDLPPLLAPARLCRILDLDRRRIYELIATGDLAAIRTGTRGLRIYRDSVIAWLRQGGCQR